MHLFYYDAILGHLETHTVNKENKLCKVYFIVKYLAVLYLFFVKKFFFRTFTMLEDTDLRGPSRWGSTSQSSGMGLKSIAY